MAQLQIRDYERILDLVQAVLHEGDPDSAWHLTAERLHAAVGCVSVILARLPSDGLPGVADGWSPYWLGPDVGELIARRMEQGHPMVPYLLAGNTDPVRVTDLCDDWRQAPWYTEARDLCGTTQQIALPLPGGPPGHRALSFGRVGDFHDRDVEFLRRVQPLLVTMDSHLRELSRLRAAVAAAPTPDDHGLTPRETTVLGLLAEGLTTQAIGRRLGISPHTVNRHLEKVYRKLGANNRVTAVALARRGGLVA
ncbi:response regulator transcription factor [Streptomyces gamaensis]|uniref:Response regulator transcription factor n=1 Tax=Streptomyces gamaensis TaxID=1763542 RepID=A0ABW0YUC7_9ACTN